MKKVIIAIFVFATVLSFNSCKEDVLEKVPLDIISDNAVWGDQALIDAYLTQVYSDISIFTNETPGNDAWVNDDLWFGFNVVNDVSDECKFCWVDILGMSTKYGTLTINGGLLEWWENSYKAIRSLNEFIEKLPASPVDAAFRKQRIAEARFLRAFNYFSMAKRYGGVPLITKTQSPNDPDIYPARNKEQEVYDFVLAEIDAIIGDLPETYSAADFGRPTKYAALALKSRAALYAGSIAKFGTVQLNGVVGIESSKASTYYQAAYDASKAIMSSGKHSLFNQGADKVANFRNIFLTERNPEVIMARQYLPTDKEAGGNGWAWDFMNCPLSNAWAAGNQDGPYLEMVEEFENIDGTSGKLDRTAIQQGLWTTDQLWAKKDPRFFASVYTMNTPWKGSLLDYHNGIIKTDGSIQTDGSYNGVLAVGNQRLWQGYGGTGFGVLKYLDESHDNFGPRGTSGTDWIVFRYAETLLNFAEAALELGKSSDALDAINQIRNRAGIAALTTIDRTKIRHERKVELAFEGHRYWDTRRWRTAVTDFSKSYSGLRYILDYTTRKYKLQVIEKIDGTTNIPSFYERNYYLPITLTRTGNNPKLVENPGYN